MSTSAALKPTRDILVPMPVDGRTNAARRRLAVEKVQYLPLPHGILTNSNTIQMGFLAP